MTITWDVATFTDPEAPINQKSAATAVATKIANVTKADLTAKHYAALLSYRVCYVTETVGKGKDQTSQGDYAKSLGVTNGYVTGYKRLGRALVLHGVEFGSDLWVALCSNNRAAGKLGAVLEGDKGSVDLAVLAESLKPKPAAPKGPDSLDTDAGGTTPAVEKPETPHDIWKNAMVVALATVRELSEAELRTAANTVTNLLDAVQKAQKATAAKAERAQAKAAKIPA